MPLSRKKSTSARAIRCITRLSQVRWTRTLALSCARCVTAPACLVFAFFTSSHRITMSQYNKINGQGDPTPLPGAKTGFIPGHWSCENPVTLGHDLKENGAGGVIGKDWSGFVMSDWYEPHVALATFSSPSPDVYAYKLITIPHADSGAQHTAPPSSRAWTSRCLARAG